MSIEALQTRNPFQSRLLQVTLAEMHSQQNAPAPSPAPSSQRAEHASKIPHFELSTSQLIRLVSRYGMDRLNFQTLQSMPMADLKPEERSFITFLRNNRDIFDRIAKLDKDPDTLSPEDIKIAAQFAGDSLTLSTEDLAYLREVSNHRLEADAETRKQQQENRLETDATSTTVQSSTAQRAAVNRKVPPSVQDLETLLTRLNSLPRANSTTSSFTQQAQLPLTFQQLMTLETTSLSANEKAQLAFLRSPTVSAMLQQVAASNQGNITPDVLRILSSLIYNPMLHGNMPIVFFKNNRRDSKNLFESHDEDFLEANADTEQEMASMKNRDRNGKAEYHVQAEEILAICHQISEDGTVSLAELRKYRPRNKQEAATMKLLAKSSIFHRLSSLDHHDETLSDEDIRLAVAEKALVFSDSSMVLVVLP